MAQQHLAACDRDGCETTEELVCTSSQFQFSYPIAAADPGINYIGGPTAAKMSQGTPLVNYRVPPHWHQFDGRDFCSWECVGLYSSRRAAEARQKALAA